jgi:hypothetical protein
MGLFISITSSPSNIVVLEVTFLASSFISFNLFSSSTIAGELLKS